MIVLLSALLLPAAASAGSFKQRLVDFYAADLDHGYFLPRIHALAGLGHLGGGLPEPLRRSRR